MAGPIKFETDWESKYGSGSTTNTGGTGGRPSDGGKPTGRTVTIGSTTYSLGKAYDLFNKGDKATKQQILSIVTTYNPGYNPTRPDAVNTAFNKILDSFSQSKSNDFTSWFVNESNLNADLLGMSSGTSTVLQPSITTAEDAYKYFNGLMRDYVGMDANKADFKSFYNQLKALEKSKVAKQTTVRKDGVVTQISTPGVTNEDREELALNYVSKYIDAKGIENVGGAIGGNLRTIRQLASDYNVALSDKEIRQYALSGLTDKNVIETVKTKMLNIAKATYQNLAPFLDKGLTVKDIASQYINKMSNVLEINPDTIKLDDRYIQTALSTLPNFGDFNRMLRNSPQWEYTDNARSEAAGYVNKILSDFGLR